MRASISIESILENLVSEVEGATGAIILALDGEAVQWHTSGNADRLCLRGAYVALILQACRESGERHKLSRLKGLVLEYQGASFVAQEIDGDCFLALELSASANIGEAVFRIGSAVAVLRSELER